MSTLKQSSIPLDTGSMPNGEVCIANINTAERRGRLIFGIVAFAVSLVILAILVATGADRLWRMPLFFLFAGAGSGYFQWRDKTCVGLAKINARKTGDTMEKIEDAEELAQVKRQARRVQFKAATAGLALTLIALALPPLG